MAKKKRSMHNQSKKEIQIGIILLLIGLAFYAGYSFSQTSDTPLAEQFSLKKVYVCKTLNDAGNVDLPDLVIADLKITQPQTGVVNTEVTVKNIGTKVATQPENSPGLTVVLEDYPNVGGVNAIIPVLLPCEKRTITLSWYMHMGKHRIRAYADEFGRIKELDKTNNEWISESFEVAVPKDKHLACVQRTCALVEGAGINECTYLGSGC